MCSFIELVPEILNVEGHFDAVPTCMYMSEVDDIIDLAILSNRIQRIDFSNFLIELLK